MGVRRVEGVPSASVRALTMVVAVFAVVVLAGCSAPRALRDQVDLDAADLIASNEGQAPPLIPIILTAGGGRPPPRPPPVPPRPPPGRTTPRQQESEPSRPGHVPGRRLNGPPDAPYWEPVFEIPWRGPTLQGPRPTPPQRVPGEAATPPQAPRSPTQPPQRSSTAERVGGLEDLARFRGELDLAQGEGTLARLDVGGRSFYGINAHGQPVGLRVNAITRTHAEADAFQQAANAGVSGGRGTLYVDRALCAVCGPNGGVRGMARQLGLEELQVITPQGTQVIRP